MTRKSTKKNKTLLDLIEEKPGGPETPLFSERHIAFREIFMQIKKLPADIAAIELDKTFSQMEEYGRRMSLQDAQKLITEGYQQGKDEGYMIGCKLTRENIEQVEIPKIRKVAIDFAFDVGYGLGRKHEKEAHRRFFLLLLKIYWLWTLAYWLFLINAPR